MVEGINHFNDAVVVELTKEELQAQLTKLGVPFDRRFGEVKLLELLRAQGAENAPVSEERTEDGPSVEPEPEIAPTPPQEATEPLSTATYEVVTSIKFQGKLHGVGTRLQLNPEIAVPLLESGAIR